MNVKSGRKITLEDARNRIVLYLAYYNDRIL